MDRGFERAQAEYNAPWSAWFDALAQGQKDIPVLGNMGGLRKLPTSYPLKGLQQATNQGWGNWRSLEAPYQKLENY